MREEKTFIVTEDKVERDLQVLNTEMNEFRISVRSTLADEDLDKTRLGYDIIKLVEGLDEAVWNLHQEILPDRRTSTDYMDLVEDDYEKLCARVGSSLLCDIYKPLLEQMRYFINRVSDIYTSYYRH